MNLTDQNASMPAMHYEGTVTPLLPSALFSKALRNWRSINKNLLTGLPAKIVQNSSEGLRIVMPDGNAARLAIYETLPSPRAYNLYAEKIRMVLSSTASNAEVTQIVGAAISMFPQAGKGAPISYLDGLRFGLMDIVNEKKIPTSAIASSVYDLTMTMRFLPSLAEIVEAALKRHTQFQTAALRADALSNALFDLKWKLIDSGLLEFEDDGDDNPC